MRPVDASKVVDKDFRLFISQGLVSLDDVEKKVMITILRDTGAKQSLIRGGVLPFSTNSYSDQTY